MQTVSELMTRNVEFVAPQDSLQRAAQLMDELNVGALPVCDRGRLVGMVTDRDITVRGTAAGRRPQEAHVDEVMSGNVRWCFEDQELDDVMIQMADSQVRRIPVVSHDDEHRLVGIVSLGDVVTKATGRAHDEDAEQTVEAVSSPSQPDRSGHGGNSGDGSNRSKQASRPATDVAGRRGDVPADASIGRPDTTRQAGLDLPNAGEAGSGLGHGEVAGASGETAGGGAGAERTGATGDPRRNFGVSGEDMQKDGLPPA
ncbi:MAG: CBS domain-containing protein [Burkholderiaceae bacterium]